MAEAERRQFVLVKPQGHAHSWSARWCCGEALRLGIDDVGFVRRLVTLLLTYPLRPGPAAQLRVAPGGVFGAGWSNGGFLVTHAAAQGLAVFRAVAAISGYAYLRQLPSMAPARLPLMLHHGTHDDLVQPGGCCAALLCCCDISAAEGAEQPCVSVGDFAQLWATQLNGWRPDALPQSGGGDGLGVAAPDDPGCGLLAGSGGADTLLCLHDGAGHHLMQPQHQVAASVSDWFMRVLRRSSNSTSPATSPAPGGGGLPSPARQASTTVVPVVLLTSPPELAGNGLWRSNGTAFLLVAMGLLLLAGVFALRAGRTRTRGRTAAAVPPRIR